MLLGVGQTLHFVGSCHPWTQQHACYLLLCGPGQALAVATNAYCPWMSQSKPTKLGSGHCCLRLHLLACQSEHNLSV